MAKTLTPRLSSSRHLRFFLSLTGALKSRLTEPWGSEALTERRLSKSREATERGLCPVHLLGGHERVCCVCSRASGRPVCLLLARWFAECARPLCCHWTLGDHGRIRRPARKGAVGRTGLERGASGGWDGVSQPRVVLFDHHSVVKEEAGGPAFMFYIYHPLVSPWDPEVLIPAPRLPGSRGRRYHGRGGLISQKAQAATISLSG